MASPALNSIHCRRCRSKVSWPAQLDDGEKATLAARARADRLTTIKDMRGDFGLSLSDAKALGFHISRAGDVCVRCKNLVDKGETICSNCKSVNLNW